METVFDDDDELLPGLPNELARLQCLARLPLDAVARCRVVSRCWASALRHYSLASRRPPLPLACLCTAHVDSQRHISFAWLFLSPSRSRSHLLPFYSLPSPLLPPRLHAFSSQTQVIATGTNLLLVRSGLQFTGCSNLSLPQISNNGLNPDPEGVRVAGCLLLIDSVGNDAGALQGFDVWQMKWCRDISHAVPSMHVDRWRFATAHVGKHVYVAGGEGPGAARSAERLNMETWMWEMLPDMMEERSVNPVGFVLEGCFYVAGGEFQPTTSTEGRGLSQSGEFFDPEKGVWTLVKGMWPEELWGSGEGDPNVVVVKEVALCATSTHVMMLNVEGGRLWEVRGHLPHVPGCPVPERWYLHVVSVNDDELWAVISGKAEHPWLVFACKPQLAADDGLLRWERRPFIIPPSTQHGVLASLGIHI